MKRSLITSAVSLSLLAATGSTQAQTPIMAHEYTADPSAWSFSGYGTLGYNKVLSDVPYSFVRDLSQKAPTDQSAGSWRPDSRIGLQAAYRVSAQTDAVVQVVVRDKTEATAENSVEWAYMSHRPNENLTIRLGRVGIDAFLLSDYRSLGYAQATVRPNWDYYGFMPIYSLDGIDATYTRSTDAVRWSLKSQFGRAQAHLSMTSGVIYNFVADPFWDISVARESGPWRIKAGYASLRMLNEEPLAALTDPLNQLASLSIPGVSAEAAGLSQQLRFKDSRISYAAVGASYDDGTWVAQGEVSRVTADRQVLTQGTAHYLNIGRRIGTLTPYLGFSGFRAATPVATAQSDWATLLANPSAGTLQAMALRSMDTARVDQTTVAMGLRWDFHPQAAVKLQWDRVQVRQAGFGLWGNSNNADMAAQQINLLSASLDWVF